MLLYVGRAPIGSYSAPVAPVPAARTLASFAQLRVVLPTDLWQIAFVLLWHWNWHVKAGLLVPHGVEFLILVVINDNIRYAELSIIVGLHRLIMQLVVHLCFFVYFLAVQLLLGRRCGRVVAHLRVVLRLVLVLLLVHHHLLTLPSHVVLSLSAWVVIAYVVDVLLSNRLHV